MPTPKLKIDTKKINKKWGYEVWFSNNELYCGKEIVCVGSKFRERLRNIKWCPTKIPRGHNRSKINLIKHIKYLIKTLTNNGLWSSEGKYHYHPIKDETFYIIEGTLILDVEGKRMWLSKGDSYRIKPGVKHRFRSQGGRCKFIEVSTTHREEDSIRVGDLEDA
jgi:mannose-6-phosphate isomerase-like protein (cupin superfamily)